MSNTPAITRLDGNHDYCDFYAKFLHTNLPCLFTEIHTRTWPARINWSRNETIDVENLLKPFLGCKVCVANCSDVEFRSHPTFTMLAEDYIDYWKSFNENSTKRLLYLKDWHYFKGKDFNDYYTLPLYFSSDWLNEFSDFRTDCDDDFRFVYIGPRGTWTPLHTDVYCSYSWSANIIGHKRWWVFPPGEEKKLIARNGGQLPLDISDHDLAGPEITNSDLPQCYIFNQLPGEMFFVPSGWYHQVLNLTDCISINNNWLNACNVRLVWMHLQAQLQVVKKSCADVKNTPGWDYACQECLKAWEGWNFVEFFILLKYILISRWLHLTKEEVRQRLPNSSLPEDGRGPLCLLDEQLESLLSNVAKAEPQLLELLIGDTSDCWCVDFVDPVEGIREHDLVQAAQTIKLMLLDEDIKQLGLHSRGSAAWLWKAVIDSL